MKKGRCLVVVLLSILIAATALTPMANSANHTDLRKQVVGYFPAYRYASAFNSIDFSAMSHVILSFIRYQDGNLICDFNESQIQAVKEKCNESGAKLMISLGGWGGFSYTNNPIDTEKERTEFIDGLMYYVDTYDLDGLDIDIEITNEDFWPYFDAFASALSKRLKSQGKLLTMAVSTWFTDNIETSTYNYFDFLNLMCYDSMSKIRNYITYYRARGVSDERMIIGVPFFGSDEDGNSYTYAEIIESNKTELSQSDHYNGISYDGIPQITAKAEYSLSFGGIMIWEIGQDSFEAEYSLLHAIKNAYSVPKTDVSPVTNLTSCNTSLTGTTLMWSPSPDAVSYHIYNGPNEIGVTSEPSFSINNLTSGSIYTFKVFAVNTEGIFSISTNINIETPIDATGIAEWDSNTIYLKGDLAVYNGTVYMAQWWTRGIIPGSLEIGSSVWTYVGKAGNANTGDERFTINIQPDKTGPQKKGTLMKFKTSVSGGEENIQYQYYILKDGIVFYKSMATTDTVFEYTLQGPGDYYVIAYGNDGAGNTVSSKIVVNISQ